MEEIIGGGNQFYVLSQAKGYCTIFYPFDMAQVFLFINEMFALINHVRFGTVLAYMCGNVLRKCVSFWSKSLKTSIF